MSESTGELRIRVLILEDRPADAELMIQELRRAGYAVDSVCVQTPAEYRQQLDAGWDIILADYTLPQFNALEALKLVQEMGADIPFIIVSGSIGEEAAVQAVRLGADDYLLKDRLARLSAAVSQAVERRRLRAERRRAQAQLRESEQLFRQMAENVDTVLWLADPQATRILYVSPAYETVWGRSCSSLFAAPRSWLDVVHPADQARASDARQCDLARQRKEVTYRILRPEGDIRWIRERVFAVRSPGGEIFRLAGVAEDVTEQRNLEEQLRQSQKMEAIGQLAGGVAHDFNNILTIIQGYTQCLLNATLLEDEAREELNEVLMAAERAAGLTRQLLTFGRKQVMQPRAVDLNEVVAGVVKMLRRVIGADIALSIEASRDPALVFADPGMLEQVLMNLAVNSRDAMPAGGRLIIEVELLILDGAGIAVSSPRRSGEFVCLTVRDSGCGMPPEIMAKIFEPFFTTKGPAHGTGLGLPTVQTIARQHDGWVEVKSRVGAGTDFSVFLPRIERAAPARPKEAQMPALPGGSETILLVEDEAVVREMAAMILRRKGYRVQEASSGVAALSLWRTQGNEIDLLITDMVMPDGLTGQDLTEQLRKLRPDLKVIYTSGYFIDVMADKVDLQEGFNFLQKPYRPQSLIKIVRERLDDSTVCV